MRILFIGQSPSKSSNGLAPMSGMSGDFLAHLLGTTKDEMLQAHDFVNVFPFFPGKNSLGQDLFPMQEAKSHAARLAPKLVGRVVVLLGKNVARAFNAPQNVSYMTRLSAPGTDSVWVIPHPSRVSRHWNVSENMLIVSKFLRELQAAKEETTKDVEPK
jgi:uracil-DNA glycosylase